MGIDINDTSATMHDELAAFGGPLLVDALARLAAGTLRAIPQDATRATHAAKLSKEDALLDLSLPVRELHARIRGLTPWPGGMLLLHRPGQENLQVSLLPGSYPLTGPFPDAADAAVDTAPAGSFTLLEDHVPVSPPSPLHVLEPHASGVHAPTSGTVSDALLVRCGDGWYAFPEVRPAGKKNMSGRAFFNGYLTNAPGARFVGHI